MVEALFCAVIALFVMFCVMAIVLETLYVRLKNCRRQVKTLTEETERIRNMERKRQELRSLAPLFTRYPDPANVVRELKG